ncbi:MAG: ABC transporter permease subunit [Gammaproteobacteria bacterium]|nr:ABC transporter permease subunit [Gammaproteobacteria bacterium]
MSVWDILIKYHQGFLTGLKVTMQLTAVVWIGGIVVGTILGLASARYRVHIGIPARVISFFLSGIPILVFLFWLHYPAQAMLGIVVDPFYTAALTFTVVNIFAVTDLVRHTVDDFPEQYLTAAKVCGVPSSKIVWRIQFPIMFRQVLPGLMITQVIMLHTTLFASLISVEEIFRVAQRINSTIYRPVEIYTALGIFFLLISLPINGLALWFKYRFTRNLSER